MGYWDYTPSASGRAKPLTKKQLEKAKKAYEKAESITKTVKELEKQENNDAVEALKSLDII
jgi:hypothetical protein